MRPWAGPIGFVGTAASLAFWLVVPFVAGGNNLYVHAGNEAIYVVFAAMSVVGLAGALIAGGSSRLAPVLLGVAIIPGVAALFLPGLLVVIAMLIALQEPEAGPVRTG
ncbi:MAG TPA: hypothetical protein VLW53_11005 [Candidatus Eisenbacteria bacterium]|nr:hypothetical protein [Candidatus Eisenbacteria bacterium]